MDYDTIIITGAKWKNVQYVNSILSYNKIICYNPQLLPGDRLI